MSRAAAVACRRRRRSALRRHRSGHGGRRSGLLQSPPAWGGCKAPWPAFGRLRPSPVAGAGLLSAPRQAQGGAVLRPPSSEEYVRSPPWYAPGPAYFTRQSVARLGVAVLAWSRAQPGVTCGNPLRRSSCSDLIERGKRGWSSRRHASNHAPPLTRCLVRHLTEGPPPRFLLSVDPSACLFFVLTPDAAGFGYRCLLDWGPDR